MGPGNKGLRRGWGWGREKPNQKSRSLPGSAAVPRGYGGFNPGTGIHTVMKSEQGHRRTGITSTELPLQQAFHK